jgi:hypothetical protein
MVMPDSKARSVPPGSLPLYTFHTATSPAAVDLDEPDAGRHDHRITPGHAHLDLPGATPGDGDARVSIESVSGGVKIEQND